MVKSALESTAPLAEEIHPSSTRSQAFHTSSSAYSPQRGQWQNAARQPSAVSSGGGNHTAQYQ